MVKKEGWENLCICLKPKKENLLPINSTYFQLIQPLGKPIFNWEKNLVW